MSESITHQNLVKAIHTWLKNENTNNDMSILVDLPEEDTTNRPTMINGFRPDLYAKRVSDNRIYIGEAKTKKDLETQHSRRQLRAFLEHLSILENSILILGVPWAMVPCARGLIERIKIDSKTNCVDFIVLDRLPG
ncbi:MAG: hypothetical protein OEW87_14645 [Flavobacteriaceae bacterium]|nr:hypothetical protein [Flavobacteriaceae bacterium]